MTYKALVEYYPTYRSDPSNFELIDLDTGSAEEAVLQLRTVLNKTYAQSKRWPGSIEFFKIDTSSSSEEYLLIQTVQKPGKDAIKLFKDKERAKYKALEDKKEEQEKAELNRLAEKYGYKK